ncbi:MAG: helix-turn-helix domain-containing protein [Clostridium sp.]|nr:helix-turn-helix domain-containing protein [Clostridium sp.]
MAYQDKPPIDELLHYGMPRRSGRYPWGSGKDPYQHSGDFLSRVEELTKKGMSEKDIADSMGLTTSQLRIQKSLAKDERRTIEVDTAKGLREKGYSLNEIAKMMGYKNDSSVRSLLNEQSESRMKEAMNTAKFLKKQVDEKGMIDVGVGVERELGISKEKLKTALYILEMEGYNTFGGGVPQVNNPGKQTNIKVLCPPDTPFKTITDKNGNEKKVSSAIYDYEKVHSITEYTSHDSGKTFETFKYPSSMDSKRLAIRYAEDGGIQKDGLVEIRRGVADLDLGGSHYAQVRIMVDGTHYIKGMAVYSDDLPPGVDVMFNTNKTKDKSKLEVLKPIKNDPDNPFGSLIKAGGQSYYTDKNGERKLSLINKRAEEGDWGDWADKLPAQFLSKQSKQLAQRQLQLAAADKKAEFDEIMSLTNPTVKKALLKSFSDDCDSAAVHLHAAALPRQKYQVILPVPTLRDNEIYAPNYNDGEKVALIRYPHGGIFEIPILTVNNKHKDSIKMIGPNAKDAVCINSTVAERLSGADFDGDTVQVIPTNSKVKINTKPPLKALEGFDPKMEYPERPGMKYMKTGKKDNTQNEMGKISNLITDMTLLGASDDELARAVRHSMVVIDAAKHKLDYKKSEADNNIKALKKKYQGHIDPETGRYSEGTGTIVSRAKGQQSVLKRQGSPIIDPETGKQSWKVADNVTYEKKMINKRTGKEYTKTITKTQKSTKMMETDDAYTLVSDSRNPIELVYADYANQMKALANQARKEMVTTPDIPYNPEAKARYQKEAASLQAKVNVALKNAPRERQAQTMANAILQAKIKDNPDMTKKEKKKAGQQALDKMRMKVGAKKEPVKITEQEWEAIQAGAISPSKLKTIINNADLDTLRQMAMPRSTKQLSQSKINHIATLKASGYTNAQIAQKLGVSTSTVSKYLN